MRRTQLYLDDQLWNALHAQARIQRTTISALVREAARERYLGSSEDRARALQDFIGSMKRPGKVTDAVEEVRRLRKGRRLERFLSE